MFKKREVFLPYCLPDITESEIEEMIVTLESGWLAKGPRTHMFEQRFAEYVGAKHAIAMNSCTAALHIALVAAGIGPGDEVITSPMTFAASANTIIHTGATPVFVDIDPETGCIDPAMIENAITGRTKAIVPIHYAGQACDLDAIYAIAKKHSLFVSEDAAHGLYTQYKGRMIGAQAPGAVSYSFYATKNLCTGEGGMLVTDDDTIAQRARVLSSHGMSKNAWNRYAKGGSWKYDIEEIGFKYNMCDLQAALGLQQLERLGEMQNRRDEIARLYNQAFAGVKGIKSTLVRDYTTVHSWHLYTIHIDHAQLGLSRDQMVDKLQQLNVGTSVHFTPVHMMTAYQRLFEYGKGCLPRAEEWGEQVLSLPLYPSMKDRDVSYVAQAVMSVINDVTERSTSN
jgi:dTDP-4-amino-4,6-dideoxygalactose transaminase